MTSQHCLVFVYNADSGLFNLVTDMAHKIFSPDTYACHLCAITHGNFAMRSEWRAFLESLPAELEFLHRDELAQRYGLAAIPLPAILLKGEVTPVEWISAEEIKGCRSLEELQRLISQRLASLPAIPGSPP